MSEVAVPDITVSVLPSPQLTEKEAIVPSGSVAENATVTIVPALAGLGETFETVTVGGRSLIVSVAEFDPGPALFVAVTVIVKV